MVLNPTKVRINQNLIIKDVKTNYYSDAAKKNCNQSLMKIRINYQLKNKHMKKLSLTILVALLAVVFTESKAQNATKIDATGFTGIENSISANVNFYQSAEYKVELIAPKDIADELKIFVEDGMLKLKKKDKTFNWSSSDDKIIVNVWAPKFNVLSLNGSGDMLAKTAISTDDLVIKINGSGDVKIGSLEATSLTVKSNGSGDVNIGGTKTMDKAEYSINGSGDIDVYQLPCKSVTANVNGSGDIKVWAAEEIVAKVVGSGDIEVKGDPRIDAKVVGSGSIKRNK